MNDAEQNTSEPAGLAVGPLRSFIERIERLEEEKGAIAADIKDAYNEAAAQGFDKKVMKSVVKKRKQDRDARLEEEAILDLYMDALGMPRGA